MTYATVTNLLDQFSAEEIAQRADRGIPRLVSAAMLRTAAAGGDLSDYNTDEQQATAAALAIIEQRLLDADSVVNGYLSTRYQVPMENPPRLVIMAAGDLARYALYDDAATEQITNRYKDAIKLLESISRGAISLGLSQAGSKPATAGSAQIDSAGKTFVRDGSFV